METYKLRDLSFAYPGEEKPALKNISLSVSEGEFITLCGMSGSGKSTLLRHLKTALTPSGKRSGEIFFCGSPLSEASEREQAEKIGFVMQSPDHQSVTDKVWHELAFGLESLGAGNDIIRRKTAETASFFGIEDWYEEKISSLSGGQRQILNLACAVITSPDVLILDEPTAQLDPVSSERFITLLQKLNKELGLTIIMSEHDLDCAFSCSSRILLMEKGSIISDASPEKTAGYIYHNISNMKDALPEPAFLTNLLSSSPRSVSFTCARAELSSYISENPPLTPEVKKPAHDKKEIPALEMDSVYFRYERSGRDILSGLSVKAYRGEILSVLGANGTGKTTFLTLAGGISRQYRGRILYDGKKKCGIRMAYLPQDPGTMFVCESVMAELEEAAGDVTEKQLEKVIRQCRLRSLLHRHPYDLSGGEQQRAALAKLLLLSPGLLILDEPVKGMDIRSKNEIGRILRAIAAEGKCIILVSHDMDFCANYSDRCAMLFSGELIGTDEPHGFFCGNDFYTTQARRLTSGLIDNCVTRRDILYSLRRSDENSSSDSPENDTDPDGEDDGHAPALSEIRSRKKSAPLSIQCIRRSKRQLIIMLLTMLMAVPLTVFAGIYFFGDTKYLFISLLIMLECMFPFFMMFEKRHIRAREAVLIAVMSALIIISRGVFYMLPEFKPLTALVIISGVSLGAEAGFMIGAFSMLGSNIIFGQGPWTPWQMFAMGLIGLLAGLIPGSRSFPKKRILFSLFGFLAALIIYGGIMDPAAAIMSHIELNAETLISYYIAGLPLDLIHAVSTAIFIFIGSYPIIRKLERIKRKYGIVDVT